MATQFPEELDSFLNPQPTDSVAAVSHAAQHADANDAIEALQAKLGTNNSTDPSSIEYRVKALEDQPFDSEAVMDAVDSVLIAGSGITKLYDDSLDTLTVSVDTTTISTRTYADDVANLAAGTALTNANDYTDIAITALSAVYDPLGSASAAQTAAQLYADGLAVNYDPAGSASAALSDANEYTDIAVAGLGNSLPNIYVPISDVGAQDGVAQLVGGFVPLSQLNITEEIQDVAAQMITSGTHTNISVSYNDQNGTISFTGSAPQLTQEEIQDYVAPLFNHGLHTNITATYDDQNNKILLTSSSTGGSLTQEEVQDFVAPLLNHAFHTNITASYDDANNRIVLQGNSGGGGGASVIISPTAPSTPGLGDIWLDSDNGKTYIWDGAFWIEVGGSSSQAIAAVTSIPPTSPVLGSIWLNSSTAKTYIYDGSFWVEV